MSDVLALEARVEAVGRPLRLLRTMSVWKFLRGERLFVVTLLHARFTGRVEIFCNGELRFRNGWCAYCRCAYPFRADGVEMGVERVAHGFLLRVERVPFESLPRAPPAAGGRPETESRVLGRELYPRSAFAPAARPPSPPGPERAGSPPLSRITITEFVPLEEQPR